MTKRAAIGLVGALVGALGGCGDNLAPPPVDRCEGMGIVTQAATAADRKILGVGAPYPADGTLRGRDEELARSMKARRQAAWTVVGKALEPVALAQDLPADVPEKVPRWQTWLGRDDVVRLFQRLYRALSPADKAARVRFSDASLDDAFVWNVHAVEELPSWPEERWREYLAGIDEAAEVGGLGGIARVSYGPAAARHLLASYPEAVKCLEQGAPPPFADGPGGPRRVVREPLAIAGCEGRTYGPYFVHGGETLRARVDGDAEVRVRVGARDAQPSCTAAAGQTCEAAGPGPAWVEVAAGPDGTGQGAALTVEYAEANPEWAACVDGAFPLDAVVVKADWRRAGIGDPLPTYDTSAAGLTRRLRPGGVPDWGAGDGAADPGPDDIYTVQLANGARYRLAALHIMTKELDHWMWTTLWWSADPDSDFGADRPAAIAAAGPWRHYKMCTVTAFAEGDPDPDGGYGATSLGQALAATRAGGAPSWCSNPYLEEGHGNAASSCIGCHQHGASSAAVEEIIDDEGRFPAHGRTQVRNNFPADYSWALNAGDRLAPMYLDEIKYWE